MENETTEQNDPFEHLYAVPLDVLELSEEAYQRVVNSGVDNVGDCLHSYGLFKSAMVSISSDGLELMFGEVKEKLIEHGYWSYVENDL